MKNLLRGRRPTHEELMEFVDGTLPSERQREIESLAEVSSSLQKEIALLRAIGRAVQTERTPLPSQHFTKNVMKEILPAQRESFMFRLLKNSSNVFAMILVLSLIGIVLFASPGSSTTAANPLSRQLDTFTTMYDAMTKYIAESTKHYTQPLNEASKTTSGKVFFIALVIFSLFVAIDQIFGKKSFHARMKN